MSMYLTRSGYLSEEQLQAELSAAGYGGPWDVGSMLSAYDRAKPAAAATSTQGQVSVNGQMVNVDVAKYLLDKAEAAANNAYLKAKLDLDTEDNARARARDAADAEVAKARLELDEERFGWQKQTDVAGLTGFWEGKKTLGREAEENKTALGFLDLAARQRGPANAFQYARLLNSTPRGFADIVDAAAGRYQMNAYGGATSGEQPQRATLGTLLSDVAGAAAGGAYVPDTSGLVAGSRINAANYQRMSPTQRDLLWAGYEDRGEDPRDVQAAFAASLPKYGGPRRGRQSLF